MAVGSGSLAVGQGREELSSYVCFACQATKLSESKHFRGNTLVNETRDRKKSIGILVCRICRVDYSTEINELSEPIDVYGDWIGE